MQENINTQEQPANPIVPNAEKSSLGFFFTASTFKLSIMSICTFGIYELFWFYKNWVLIKERSGQNIMPFWRAFFAPIWAYSCFKHIKAAAGENHVPESLPIGRLAIAFFIINALWKLPDPFWLLAFLSFTVLIPANDVALKINKYLNPDFKNNEKFSGWNWAGVVLGGILLIFNIITSFMPDA